MAAFIAGCCLASARLASASCGDYLAMPGHSHDSGVAKNASDHQQPKPCRGSQCRQRGPLETPPPPGPPSVSVEVRQAAASLLAADGLGAGAQGWLSLPHSLRPVSATPHRLDRPPKAA